MLFKRSVLGYSALMIEDQAEVAFNRPLTSDTWLMGLRSAAISGSAYPGQFVMVRVRKGVDPLLRRPFSICGVEGDLFLLLYRVVGKGSEIMTGIEAGGRVSVLGPLGNGFRIPEDDRKMLLAAGGIGIAPLLFLAHRLGSREFRFMAGFGSADGIIPVQEVLDLSRPLQVSTDDGTQGHHGPVTDLLQGTLHECGTGSPCSIFTCGPRGMLKSVARIAGKDGIACQVSMEASMACGLGACLGCVVPAAPGETRTYYHVCSEGPVFDATMIDWEAV
ncbi:MAG: dihydroorotate dehydrogenase electron transfer subunit [Deltaproteobacteria bacterium HGW-Deltaproteobacteria-21]|nr:MAG: dihydroorotate dehydrogenase electron transfer subunit [Deltaproteobacteria bacterium HGW-Deltaproteobacteria-21]